MEWMRTSKNTPYNKHISFFCLLFRYITNNSIKKGIKNERNDSVVFFRLPCAIRSVHFCATNKNKIYCQLTKFLLLSSRSWQFWCVSGVFSVQCACFSFIHCRYFQCKTQTHFSIHSYPWTILTWSQFIFCCLFMYLYITLKYSFFSYYFQWLAV